MDYRQIILITCSIVSIVSCLAILFMFFKGRKQNTKNFTFRIILYMSLADIVRSLLYFITPSDEYCKFIAYAILIAYNIDLYWTCCISITLYLVLVKGYNNYRKYHTIWSFISFILNPLISALPFITNSCGQ